jgi:hypothetical protein
MVLLFPFLMPAIDLSWKLIARRHRIARSIWYFGDGTPGTF